MQAAFASWEYSRFQSAVAALLADGRMANADVNGAYNILRKYFPVVYSCRFAEMANKKGKVLVPDKEIKTAFFEEHHPESLARLDEYEQLGLF
ncbi:hypothetical protein [Megasphaera elsdenii]|uniref:hypothetical protein n=1 Tax=Megasphaera elsdenii TaxID=907 RepID=UPI00266F6BEB|nr:hypothetical protein [Megasphaera elsdenii]MCI7200411.1 hypothetical protein [Megasphaera elsdenii]MDY4265526.1 hypothetical protein [Megasphaera elsdenii]